jgi:hypothetical protein
MISEGESTGGLVMLARAVGSGDYVDPGQLVRAAIRVMDGLPEDEDSAAIADTCAGPRSIGPISTARGRDWLMPSKPM